MKQEPRLSEGYVKWIAERLVTQLRGGDVPLGVEPEDFIWYPCLDRIWSQVGSADREWVMALMVDPATKIWGRLLSRGLPESGELVGVLLDQFNRASSPEDQLGAFHEVTFWTADRAVREQMYDWLQKNMLLFLHFETDYVGEAFGGDVLAFCRARLADPAYERKRWMYFFTALACEDKLAARDFVAPFQADDDSFMARMAETALAELRTETA